MREYLSVFLKIITANGGRGGESGNGFSSGLYRDTANDGMLYYLSVPLHYNKKGHFPLKNVPDTSK